MHCLLELPSLFFLGGSQRIPLFSIKPVSVSLQFLKRKSFVQLWLISGHTSKSTYYHRNNLYTFFSAAASQSSFASFGISSLLLLFFKLLILQYQLYLVYDYIVTLYIHIPQQFYIFIFCYPFWFIPSSSKGIFLTQFPMSILCDTIIMSLVIFLS